MSTFVKPAATSETECDQHPQKLLSQPRPPSPATGNHSPASGWYETPCLLLNILYMESQFTHFVYIMFVRSSSPYCLCSCMPGVTYPFSCGWIGYLPLWGYHKSHHYEPFACVSGWTTHMRTGILGHRTCIHLALTGTSSGLFTAVLLICISIPTTCGILFLTCAIQLGVEWYNACLSFVFLRRLLMVNTFF